MKKYLAIDGGTTNTRLYYVIDNEIKKVVKLPLGVRVNIDEPGRLQREIHQAVDSLFSEFGPSDCILASGMITSDLGLICLPHLPVPAGLAELHESMMRTELPEIAPVPFYFVRGLRQSGEDFTQCDMMRGEECEIMGLMRPEDGVCAYVLPGSHSKVIFVDEEGRVKHFLTTLSGEMIAALSSGTILKSSVDLNQPLEEEFLLKGYQTAEKMGVNAALFKTRILDTLFGADPAKIYSYFVGVVLSEEVQVLKNCDAQTVLLAGQKRLAEATAALLQSVSDKKIILADEERCSRANLDGMIRVFEYGQA